MKILVVLLILVMPSAQAALQVFACEPEWAALSRELGGDAVKVYSATTGLQDVHHIQARPSLIARAGRAELLVCSGAELEIGWLPVLLRRAHNPRIQPGGDGYLMMAEHVALRDRPQVLDRAEGDVHPQGNPHVHLDPRHIATLAPVLSERLQRLDPAHAADYQQRLTDFNTRWSQALQRWTQQIQPLKGKRIVVYHAGWSYFNAWSGLQQVATIEPKPGITPSSQHLAALLEQLRRQPAALIVYASYQDSKAANWLHDKTGIPALALPFTVGGAEGTDTLFDLFDSLVRRLGGALADHE